jgi:hypothetical protein
VLLTFLLAPERTRGKAIDLEEHWWEGDFLVGSLKARSLCPIEMEKNTVTQRETLLEE